MKAQSARLILSMVVVWAGSLPAFGKLIYTTADTDVNVNAPADQPGGRQTIISDLKSKNGIVERATLLQFTFGEEAVPAATLNLFDNTVGLGGLWGKIWLKEASFTDRGDTQPTWDSWIGPGVSLDYGVDMSGEGWVEVIEPGDDDGTVGWELYKLGTSPGWHGLDITPYYNTNLGKTMTFMLFGGPWNGNVMSWRSREYNPVDPAGTGDENDFTFTPYVEAIPEPATAGLAVLGLMTVCRRKRR